ncbi:MULTISPECIES: hypothetical protein [unclassified Rhizobium]|uniref:hypothetical protein n=1 Tax=unclassified Rhizobium TaxID=2613769 RepID=UPI001ADBB06E|nr:MULTISPECIES: hypothetical protein [unclassified Rhizobium]MBO9125436.1 hypothetical protein [Rhizobium sp. 16-488-2b]MBO9176021.1 hypothetical protein [Rhizobium sp. 16-488-2a]
MIDLCPFNEIHLMNHTVVHWRLADGGWEIAAYRTSSGGGMLRSITGDLIKRTSGGGPGTEEFSETLGMVMMIACTKIQSDRVNGPRR